ncbi:MAG: helix-turn-helix domain-containing protein [Gammaproteobacteria bacterium]|nr:helix-turn-helix domain-containing protein [Gammaproteobacteria bacterium]
MIERRWVTVEKASAETGLTREAIWAYRKKGQIRLGEHFVKKGRRIFIDMNEFYRWLEGTEA